MAPEGELLKGPRRGDSTSVKAQKSLVGPTESLFQYTLPATRPPTDCCKYFP